MRSFPHRSEYNAEASPPWDRLTSADDHRMEALLSWTNGAYPGSWAVTPGSGMAVQVAPGAGRIQGVFCYDEAVEGEYVNKILAVQMADATYPRIDRVVVRLNDGQDYRNCDWYVLQGTPAQSPVAPALTRSSEVYELGVANVYIPANSTGISSDRIIDTRLDSTLCGLSTTLVWDLALSEITELLDSAIDDTTAGNLQNQIDALKAAVNVTVVVNSPASASTANKGSIARDVAIGEYVELYLLYGNTAAEPTITINGVVHSTLGIPDIGSMYPQVEAGWSLLLKKITETSLGVVLRPGWVFEKGTIGRWTYKRFITGAAECRGIHSKGSNNAFSASGAMYVSEDMTVSIPTGMFARDPDCTGMVVATTAAEVIPIRRALTRTSIKYALLKTSSLASYYNTTIKLEGEWQ